MLGLIIAVLLAILSYALLRNTDSSHLTSFISVLQANRSPAAFLRSTPQQTNYTPSANQSNNSNTEFTFHTLNGTTVRWSFPSSLYGKYLSPPAFVPVLVLNDTVNGKMPYTYDYSSLVTPSLFANVIGNLTAGRTASQFVNEVFNFREQLTTYSLVFGNTSAYPLVILADREGDCKDFSVLMASMLEAGNMQANYGMRIQFLYLDYPNATDPKVVNHLILNVIYKNGTSQILESTGIILDPYKAVDGWYLNLTCNATSCNPLTACPAGEVLGKDGMCHAECGGSGTYCSSGFSCYESHCVSCKPGYVLGNDGQCHAACGDASTYCTSGTCYNGKCVSCSPGTVVGNDGACHESCGSGYCSSGSSCYNNQCISCPAGYGLGADGICHHE